MHINCTSFSRNETRLHGPAIFELAGMFDSVGITVIHAHRNPEPVEEPPDQNDPIPEEVPPRDPMPEQDPIPHQDPGYPNMPH